MTEIKYPAYQWLTLEQANVEHLSLTYAEFLLEQYQRSLADSKKYFEFLCEDAASCKNERFISECLMPKLDKCKVDIKNAEHDVSFLKQAIVFLKSE